MSEAILAAAEKRKVSGIAAQIIRAGQINRILGTNLAPWELELIPADWLDALESWIDDLPKALEWQNEVSAAMAKLRNRSRNA